MVKSNQMKKISKFAFTTLVLPGVGGKYTVANLSADTSSLARITGGYAFARKFNATGVGMDVFLGEMLNLGENITFTSVQRMGVVELDEHLMNFTSVVNTECGGPEGCLNMTKIYQIEAFDRFNSTPYLEMKKALVDEGIAEMKVFETHRRALEKGSEALKKLMSLLKSAKNITSKNFPRFQRNVLSACDDLSDAFESFNKILEHADAGKFKNLNADLTTLLNARNVSKSFPAYREGFVSLKADVQHVHNKKKRLSEVLNSESVGLFQKKLEILKKIIFPGDYRYKKTATRWLPGGFNDISDLKRHLEGEFVKKVIGGEENAQRLEPILLKFHGFASKLKPLSDKRKAIQLPGKTPEDVLNLAKMVEEALTEVENVESTSSKFAPLQNCSTLEIPDELNFGGVQHAQSLAANIGEDATAFKASFQSNQFDAVGSLIPKITEIIENGETAVPQKLNDLQDVYEKNEDVLQSVDSTLEAALESKFVETVKAVSNNIPKVEQWIKKVDPLVECIMKYKSLQPEQLEQAVMKLLNRSNPELTWLPDMVKKLEELIVEHKKVRFQKRVRRRSARRHIDDEDVLFEAIVNLADKFLMLAKAIDSRTDIKQFLANWEKMRSDAQKISDPKVKAEALDALSDELKAWLTATMTKAEALEKELSESGRTLEEYNKYANWGFEALYPSFKPRKLAKILRAINVESAMVVGLMGAHNKPEAASLQNIITELHSFFNGIFHINPTTNIARPAYQTISATTVAAEGFSPLAIALIVIVPGIVAVVGAGIAAYFKIKWSKEGKKSVEVVESNDTYKNTAPEVKEVILKKVEQTKNNPVMLTREGVQPSKEGVEPEKDVQRPEVANKEERKVDGVSVGHLRKARSGDVYITKEQCLLECKDAPPPIDEKKKEEQQAPADGGTVNLEVASLEMQKLMSDFEEPDDKTLSPEQKRLMNQMTLSAKKLDSQRGLPVYTDKVEYSAEALVKAYLPILSVAEVPPANTQNTYQGVKYEHIIKDSHSNKQVLKPPVVKEMTAEDASLKTAHDVELKADPSANAVVTVKNVPARSQAGNDADAEACEGTKTYSVRLLGGVKVPRNKKAANKMRKRLKRDGLKQWSRLTLKGNPQKWKLPCCTVNEKTESSESECSLVSQSSVSSGSVVSTARYSISDASVRTACSSISLDCTQTSASGDIGSSNSEVNLRSARSSVSLDSIHNSASEDIGPLNSDVDLNRPVAENSLAPDSSAAAEQVARSAAAGEVESSARDANMLTARSATEKKTKNKEQWKISKKKTEDAKKDDDPEDISYVPLPLTASYEDKLEHMYKWADKCLTAKGSLNIHNALAILSSDAFVFFEDFRKSNRQKKYSFPLKFLLTLFQCATTSFTAEKAYLEDLEGNFMVFGDFHGQFTDMMSMLFSTGIDIFNSDQQYMFLGDYGDRGKRSLCTLVAVAILKVKSPTRFIFLRGNHELERISRCYGLWSEIKELFGDEAPALWKEIQRMFCEMPLAAKANNYFMCHGMPSYLMCDSTRPWSELIKKDPTTEEEKEIFKALLWSDPSNRFVKGDEGKAATFEGKRGVHGLRDMNPILIRELIKKHKLAGIWRAHEFQEFGVFDSIGDGLVITFYSGSNAYDIKHPENTSRNFGAVGYLTPRTHWFERLFNMNTDPGENANAVDEVTQDDVSAKPLKVTAATKQAKAPAQSPAPVTAAKAPKAPAPAPPAAPVKAPAPPAAPSAQPSGRQRGPRQAPAPPAAPIKAPASPAAPARAPAPPAAPSAQPSGRQRGPRQAPPPPPPSPDRARNAASKRVAQSRR